MNQMELRAYDVDLNEIRDVKRVDLPLEIDEFGYALMFVGNDKARKKAKPLLYTGLRDKKKTKIFEGDIIRYDDTDDMSNWTRGELAQIILLPGRFVARMKGLGNGTDNKLTEEFEDCVEVVGNIYKNYNLFE